MNHASCHIHQLFAELMCFIDLQCSRGKAFRREKNLISNLISRHVKMILHLTQSVYYKRLTKCCQRNFIITFWRLSTIISAPFWHLIALCYNAYFLSTSQLHTIIWFKAHLLRLAYVTMRITW